MGSRPRRRASHSRGVHHTGWTRGERPGTRLRRSSSRSGSGSATTSGSTSLQRLKSPRATEPKTAATTATEAGMRSRNRSARSISAPRCSRRRRSTTSTPRSVLLPDGPAGLVPSPGRSRGPPRDPPERARRPSPCSARVGSPRDGRRGSGSRCSGGRGERGRQRRAREAAPRQSPRRSDPTERDRDPRLRPPDRGAGPSRRTGRPARRKQWWLSCSACVAAA